MAGDQDYEKQYEYRMRNRVFWLGKLTIDFHEDPENVECICSRVLLNSRLPAKRKSETNVPCNVYPIVDQITFPAPKILDHTLVKHNGIDTSINEITVDSTIDNSHENPLISSDSDEDTACCGFTKMMRSLSKKVKRRKKTVAVDARKNVEESTLNNELVVEPEPLPSDGEAAVPVSWENDDTPLEFSSKPPENGIDHLGYAFEKPEITPISQISWDYDVHRINQWNQPLTLQMAMKSLDKTSTIDWWDADPETCRTSVSREESVVDSDNVSTEQTKSTTKRRKKKKKPKKKPVADPIMITTKSEPEPTAFSRNMWRVTEAMPAEIAADFTIKKYWRSRYRLFSKFDEGIRLDRESWYSVTPEKVSQHIADRCRCDVIIDGFCGAGGNTIQFAFTCERVIAIDIDPVKIEMAKHNARIYNVSDRIEFIVGDFFEVVPSLKADVVFLSPPWGGPSYNLLSSFPLNEVCPPYGGKAIFDVARRVTKDVAYYLPRNINTADLMPIAKPDRLFELEQNFLTNKLVAVTAYFGSLPMTE